MLMDIATEEFSHLEIVGATIQMLLKGVNGELKSAADSSEIMQVLEGKAAMEDIIHSALTANPQFPIITGGGPTLRNSQGIPWCASYIHSNGDLTVDLRSNLASESRAKLVYEHLMKFTTDPYVKDTLSFLMTREIAHYKMFEAALETIQPNFPPGVLQSDPRFTQQYFNLSNPTSARGPWNQGNMPKMDKEWEYISDPATYVNTTSGLTSEDVNLNTEIEEANALSIQLGEIRSLEIKSSEAEGTATWSDYGQGLPI